MRQQFFLGVLRPARDDCCGLLFPTGLFVVAVLAALRVVAPGIRFTGPGTAREAASARRELAGAVYRAALLAVLGRVAFTKVQLLSLPLGHCAGPAGLWSAAWPCVLRRRKLNAHNALAVADARQYLAWLALPIGISLRRSPGYAAKCNYHTHIINIAIALLCLRS